MNTSDMATKDLVSLLKSERIGWRRVDQQHYLEQLFQNLDLDGKRVLDIGGGNGICSLYAAAMGAERVICLEPSAAGSNSRAMQEYERLQTHLKLTQVTMLPATFQIFPESCGPFDVILLHNSINHLDEQACVELEHSSTAQAVYSSLFQKLGQISAPGAHLIICDCSRHNFFAQLGMRNPFVPSIEWQKHQSPNTWIRIAGREGFIDPAVQWTTFLDAGIFEPLIANPVAAYFVASHFCLTLTWSGR